MAVSATIRSESSQRQLQPFRAHLHMRQVAELVGDVFAAELDVQGRQALQEMRLIGRLSPFVGGLVSPAFLGEFVSGHVWLEAGKVVGNITLQRGDFSGSRWRISNVAVAPAFRGQGIARALLLATLREIANKGGQWALLQVRSDNSVARRLYEELGFSNVCMSGLWRRYGVPADLPAADPDIVLRPLRATAWRARYELAQTARTSLATWAEPVRLSDYQTGVGRALGETLGALTGLFQVARWGVYEGQHLLGAVETSGSIGSGAHKMRFAVHPRAHGKLEQELVLRGLWSLAHADPGPVLAEHSGDHVQGVAALEAMGFRAERVLLTMRRLVVAGDMHL
jgi:ribosomal protein S18 acetylase RimI-like enzyme